MTEETAVPDLRGTPVGVGDTIVYGATDGRSAGLRIGKVTEIVWKREVYHDWDNEQQFSKRQIPTKLRVEVEVSSGYGTPEKPVLIEAGFKRFVKLD